MEYQKVINLWDNETPQPSRCWTKNWVDINDNSRGRFNTNSQNKFKTTILKSNLYDYNITYALVKGAIENNAKGLDIVMPMYNLIEYSNNSSKISGSLWQY